MYIRISIAPRKMTETKDRPHSMGSDHWFATYFDKGGNVNKYIDMIEKKYSEENFDDDERRRFLIAHMSNEYALKLAIYLRERGICIFNSTYDEDIKYMRAIFETAEQREERLRKEKKLAGIEDGDLKHAEMTEEQIKAEEAEALETKKKLEIKVLLMKCGLKSSKPKNDEILPKIKEERASAVKEERPLDSKEENALNVKKEKKANEKKKNREAHVYDGILMTNKSLDNNETNHPTDKITQQIINDIILEKSKPPLEKSKIDNTKSKVTEYVRWKDPTTEFEKKKEKYLKTVYKLNGIIFEESQVAQNGEMTVIARLSHLLDTGQFADVNIRVGTGNNAAIFKAHRLLLATASQPLHKLVYSVNPNPGPKEITTIRLQDMTPQEFEHVLKYIYTDAICCKSVDEAFNLLKSAKRFGLFGLSTRSLEFLEKFIEDFQPTDEESKNSLFDLLVMAQEKRLNDLTEKCWSLLYKFVEEVIPCESFLNLEYDITLKIFTNADFKYTDQLKLFHAIRDWGLTYIKRKNKKIQEMGELVEELMKCIDFSKIEDGDFVQSVLTSNCLGKAELINFFMSHNMDVPRDISNNKTGGFWAMYLKSSEKDSEKMKKNQLQGPEGSSGSKHLETISENDKMNGISNGTGPDYKKVRRFKRGYLLPQQEMSLEHELRFRCDKNIKLFGVGCGFLFSNTDMGVALHCQGPWETKQWTDMMQRTYCRVSSDKKEIANINLMYAAPIELQANQSYKILVKIVRMSGGSSEVDLWGGTEGHYTVENDGDEFSFLKAAVDPNKTVEESEGDTKPSLITEIFYALSDGIQVLAPVGSIPRRQRVQEKKETVVSPPPVVEQQREQALDVFAPKEIRRRQRDPTIKTPEDTTAVLRSFMESGSVVGGIRKRSNEQKSDSNTYISRWDTSEKSTEPSSTTSYTRRTSITEKPVESPSITRCRESIDRSIETTSNITKRRESIDRQQKEAERTKAADNISSILANRRNDPPSVTEKPAFMRRREAAAEAAVPWAGRSSLKSSTDSTPSWLSRSASASRANTLSDTAPSLRSRDTSLSSRFGTTGSSSNLTSRFGSGTSYGSSSTTGDPLSQSTDQIPSKHRSEGDLPLAVSVPIIHSTRQKIPSKQQNKQRKKNKKSNVNISLDPNDQNIHANSTEPPGDSKNQNVLSKKQPDENLLLDSNIYVDSTEPTFGSINENKSPHKQLNVDQSVNVYSTEPLDNSTNQNVSPEKQTEKILPPTKIDHSVNTHFYEPQDDSKNQNELTQEQPKGNISLSIPEHSVNTPPSTEQQDDSLNQITLTQKTPKWNLTPTKADNSVYEISTEAQDDSTNQNALPQEQPKGNLKMTKTEHSINVYSDKPQDGSPNQNILPQKMPKRSHIPTKADHSVNFHSTEPWDDSANKSALTKKRIKEKLTLTKVNNSVNVHSTEPLDDSANLNALQPDQPKGNPTPAKTHHSTKSHVTEPRKDSTTQDKLLQKQLKKNIKIANTDKFIFIDSTEPWDDMTNQNVLPQKQLKENLPLSKGDHSMKVHSTESRDDSTNQNTLPQNQPKGNLIPVKTDHSAKVYSNEQWDDSTSKDALPQTQPKTNIKLAKTDHFIFIDSTEPWDKSNSQHVLPLMQSKGKLIPDKSDHFLIVQSTEPWNETTNRNLLPQNQTKENLPPTKANHSVNAHSIEPWDDSANQNTLPQRQPKGNLTPAKPDYSTNVYSTDPQCDSTNQNIIPQKKPKCNLTPSKFDHSVCAYSAKPRVDSIGQNKSPKKKPKKNLMPTRKKDSKNEHSVESPVDLTSQNIPSQAHSKEKFPFATPVHSVAHSDEPPVNSTGIEISSQQQHVRSLPLSSDGLSAYKRSLAVGTLAIIFPVSVIIIWVIFL